MMASHASDDPRWLITVAEVADDLVRQRADGLEDIFEDNFQKLATTLGIELTDDA
jgi:hypothetical protein